MRRLGVIVECGRDGADHKVLANVIPRLRPDVALEFAFLGSKRALLTDGPTLAKGLLDPKAGRCERVVIVWDLVPCDLPDAKGKPCRRNEREAVRAALEKEGVALDRVTLLCITHELEAWLLADGAALTGVLERPTHPIKRVKDDRALEDHPNPKKLLQKLFKEHRGRDYLDARHAGEIVSAVSNLAKLDAAPSFRRLRALLDGL